jgi:hypothetical protein
MLTAEGAYTMITGLRIGATSWPLPQKKASSAT